MRHINKISHKKNSTSEPPMPSFSKKKLKKITPKISERLDSYTTNSCLGLLKLRALGMAMALLFLLFGFLIDVQELLDLESLAWAGGICGGIFLVRYIQLRLLRLHPIPLLFIAPRGLITILLFLTIPAAFRIPLVTKPLIIQVIILTALVMMVGLMVHKKPKTEKEAFEENESPSDANESDQEKHEEF
jgi:hypothetical protein